MFRFVSENKKTVAFVELILALAITVLLPLKHGHALSTSSCQIIGLTLISSSLYGFMFQTKKVLWIAPALVVIASSCLLLLKNSAPDLRITELDWFSVPIVCFIGTILAIICLVIYGIIIKRAKEELVFFVKDVFVYISLLLSLLLMEIVIGYVSVIQKRAPSS